MLLSIIIVNYNVKYFLEQCLCSVEKAVRGMEAAGAGGAEQVEVFVVDNGSTDGSVEWLPDRWPEVQFLFNKENIGFGAANNQALPLAEGKYILFLNPDTLLAEDSLATCLAFMGSDGRVGAAGVRMIDGAGSYLPESSRGFPSPWAAFAKLTGLAFLFPRSRLFARYYLGHLSSTANHPAPVLSGACMIVRKEALKKTGGFDERFFLYAEDIDLSYRIEQAGYINYYIADTTVIHFKGESTQKDGQYVKLFYKAMGQFRRKHFKGRISGIVNGLMEPAIWLRAGVARMGARGHSRRGSAAGERQAGSRSAARLWVGGDETEAERVRELLAAHGGSLVSTAGRMLASGPEEADEIMLCEGASFSFKEIIAVLESSGKTAYMIHAAGSAAAVGSRSRNERGETILISNEPAGPGQVENS